MIENSIVDFLMAELEDPTTCPQKIRQAVKCLVSAHSKASQGRTMLTGQLIDSLFEVHRRGQCDIVELGMTLKAKLKRYAFSGASIDAHAGEVIPLLSIRRENRARLS